MDKKKTRPDDENRGHVSSYRHEILSDYPVKKLCEKLCH
jgi:hypothetical protein